MKINTLHLMNFHGITDQEIVFASMSTVIFGVNGVGKSSILRAINLLYSSIINRIVKNRFKQGINLEIDDIKNGTSTCSIKSSITLHDQNEYNYGRFMKRSTKERTHSKAVLDDLCESFISLYGYENDKNMPMYANYSVNRAVIDVPLRIVNRHEFDKLSSFEKAIESKIDFRTFFEWFRNQEDYENQIRVRNSGKYVDKQLEAVRMAIISMLEGFSNLRIERNPLRMVIKKGNTNLRIEQLSDGEKCTLAMIGDLARRLALANPHLDNPLLGVGVVLIDEIELHMHPSWQRKIVNSLRNTFPHIQFIITTHSPQVLGELGDEVNILKIASMNNTLSIIKTSSLDSWDTNYILEEFMETPSLNPLMKENIANMYDLIKDKKYTEAQRFVNILSEKTDNAHEDVVKAKILIARGQKGI